MRGPIAHLAVALGCVWLTAALLAQTTQPSTSPATDPLDEYRRRVAELDPQDVEGHYTLAEWCERQGEYELLLRQARHVLKLAPDHTNARLLAAIATEKLTQDPAGVNAGPPNRGPDLGSGFLTHRDIQTLRFIELQPLAEAGMHGPHREPEFVQVRFERGLIDAFLDDMANHPDFRGRTNRQRFLELSPTVQLQIIRWHTGEKYADGVDILNDPLTFRLFKRVLPTIVRGCATTGCHGGSDAARPFALRTIHVNTDANLYTNFLILDRVGVGQDRLVDRDRPAESLVLQYGLPERDARRTHRPEIRPIFGRGYEDPRFQAVLAWIRSLRLPPPQTGIELEGYPEPPPPGASLQKSPSSTTRPPGRE